MTKNTALFGAGYFGSVHIGELYQLGYLGCIVETDPEKREIAEKYNVPFYHIRGTDYKELNKQITESSEPGKLIEDSLNEEGALEESKKKDNWDIVTHTPSHFPLAVLGLEYGKNLFIEKPPAENIDQLEYIMKYPNKIGVDYIEMAHPVVQANKEDMLETDFVPAYSLNVRSKDLRGNKRGMGGGEGTRITLEDLLHDLSEIDLFRKYVTEKSFAEESPEVVNAKIQRWNELPEKDENGNPKYPYNTDVRAEFKLKFPDGTEADVKGGFADPEVRQYVVVDEEGKTAQYGNTLTRPNMNPIAARVEGKGNVDYVLEKTRGKYITDQEKQEKLLRRANAETLEDKMNKYVPEAKWVDGKPRYERAPLYNMLDNFFNAKSNKKLVCPLSQALEYQKIAEGVYKEAGKLDAMYS